jgi:predicted secreted protein
MTRISFCAAAAVFAAGIAAVLAACVCAPVSRGAGKGNSVTVELPGTPSTGCRWTWTAGGEGVVKEVYAGFTRDGKNVRPGSGGVFVFIFEGETEGVAELVFTYARPWEDGGAAETVRYAFTVDKTKRITALRVDE